MAWPDYSIYLVEDVNNRNDIAGTVLGFSIEQVAEAGQMGRGNAVIELDNQDGRYTPYNGGTYSDVDWFSAAIEITVGTYPTSIQSYLFAGMIVGFDLVDDGINSKVRLSVADAFSIGGRTAIVDRTVTGTTTGLADFIETYWSGTYGEVQLPTLGAGAGAEPYDDDAGPTALEIDYKLADVPQTAAMDEMNAAVLPAGPGVAFPTRLFLPDPGFPLLWHFTSADQLHRAPPSTPRSRSPNRQQSASSRMRASSVATTSTRSPIRHRSPVRFLALRSKRHKTRRRSTSTVPATGNTRPLTRPTPKRSRQRRRGRRSSATPTLWRNASS